MERLFFAFTRHWTRCTFSRDRFTSSENGALSLDRNVLCQNLINTAFILRKTVMDTQLVTYSLDHGQEVIFLTCKLNNQGKGGFTLV